jgi:hypothetical protein
VSLLRYYKIECKLLLRGPGFYLMLATVVGTLYMMLHSTAPNLDRAAYVMDLFEVYGKVTIIIVPLLATAITRRDEEWKTATMMASFPYRTWEMEAARLLSAVTLPLLTALVPMGVYAGLVLKDGDAWGMREWYTCAVWASFAIPMVCATVLAYLVGILIRKRTSYLISFFLLLSLAILIPEFIKSDHLPLSLPPPGQMWFDYSLINYMGNSYSRMWGFIDAPVFWLHRSMVAAIMVAAALVVLLLVCWRRRERVKAWLIYSTLLGLGALWVVSGIAMYGHLQERVDIADANIHFYSERLASNNNASQQRELEKLLVAGMAAGKYTEADIGEMTRVTFPDKFGHSSEPLSVSHIKDLLAGMKFQELHIDSYKLALNLQPQHGLEIQATMQASNRSTESVERFPVMLRHLFAVQEVKVNGAAATYDWEKATDVLWITPAKEVKPGEQLKIEMIYHGILNDWRRYPATLGPSRDKWEQIAFVEDARLFLPAFYGWYPVIGNGRLSEWLTPHYSADLEFAAPKAIMDTHLPHPMASFEVAVTGPSGLKLFSNAPVIAGDQAGEKGVTVTRLRLEQASGLTLFGGDLQLAEATTDGKTLRLLVTGQYPARSVEDAAQFAARNYAEATRTIKMLDGEAATSFPQTVTMAIADYPFSNMLNWSSDNIDMVDPTDGGPEARDIHFISNRRAFGAIVADIKQGKNGSIELKTGHFWLDYTAKRRAIRNGRVDFFDTQYILNNLFQAYIERRITGDRSQPLFKPVSDYFLSGTPTEVYDLLNTVYSQYGIESVYDAIRLIYNSIGTKPLDKDSNEQMEELLRGYLHRKTEGRR